MGHGHHGAGVARKELLKPLHALGVQVVGRFVEQQHVGLRQEQTAERNAAFFTAGEEAHFGVPRWQAKRVGGDFKLRVGVVAVAGSDDGFEFGLLFGERVKVGVFVAVGRVNLVEARLRGLNAAQAFFNDFAHGFVAVDQRFLRQVADLGAGVRARFAGEIFIHTGHDFEDGGFARAVETQEADFRAGEERKRNVFDDLAFRRNNFAHAVHGVDVLHGGS